MNHQTFSGFSTAGGGVLVIIVNAVFTPLLPTDLPFPEMMASSAFVWRLSLAALSVFLLMVGSFGLFKYQSGATGKFGTIAFGLAFLGSAFVFAHEWGQIFYIHNMAVLAPEGLVTMGEAEGLTMSGIEAIIGLGTFVLGWIAFAISMLVAKVFPRLGPALVIAGFFAIPLFSTVFSDNLGGALGNAVLGSGFIILGRELIKNAAGAK